MIFKLQAAETVPKASADFVIYYESVDTTLLVQKDVSPTVRLQQRHSRDFGTVYNAGGVTYKTVLFFKETNEVIRASWQPWR